MHFEFSPNDSIPKKLKAEMMAKFIIRISEKVKQHDPNGFVFIQNGHQIIKYLGRTTAAN